MSFYLCLKLLRPGPNAKQTQVERLQDILSIQQVIHSVQHLVSVDPRPHFTFSLLHKNLICNKPDIPTPSCMPPPPPQSFDSLHYQSSSTPHGRLPHHLFILDRKLCQFASQPLVEVQVFGHTAVQTNRLPFRQLSLFVMRRYALSVAGVGHPGVKRKSGF